MFNNVGKNRDFRYEDFDDLDGIDLSDLDLSEVAPELVKGLEDVLGTISKQVKKLRVAVNSKDINKMSSAIEDAYNAGIDADIIELQHWVVSLFREWKNRVEK